MRLGILGGTFDPIHIGHLIIAEEARVSLKLDQVLFVPTGQPWMKADRSISSACHRLNMVGLATESNPFFKVSDIEIKRPGETYTVDTLKHLREELEDQDELFLILGMDSLSKFGNWKQSGEILDTCTLVAAPRPGSAEVDLRLLDQIKSGTADNIASLNAPLIDISGEEIRRRVGEGLPVRYQVVEQVEKYIYDNGLYSDSGDIL